MNILGFLFPIFGRSQDAEPVERGLTTRRPTRYFSESPANESMGYSSPLLSRLLCQPEVFDPHIEAAPTAFYLRAADCDEVQDKMVTPQQGTDVMYSITPEWSEANGTSIFEQQWGTEGWSPEGNDDGFSSPLSCAREHDLCEESTRSSGFTFLDTRYMTVTDLSRSHSVGATSNKYGSPTEGRKRRPEYEDRRQQQRAQLKRHQQYLRDERYALRELYFEQHPPHTDDTSLGWASQCVQLTAEAVQQYVSDRRADPSSVDAGATSDTTSDGGSIFPEDDPSGPSGLLPDLLPIAAPSPDGPSSPPELARRRYRELRATGSIDLVRTKFPLRSRQYADRVILAQRSQQVHALLSLLTECCRQTWVLQKRLLQLYHYYINPILCASQDEARVLLELALLHSGSGTLRELHPHYSIAATDYQMQRYIFCSEWTRLFVAVKGHLSHPSTAQIASPRLSAGRHTEDEMARVPGSPTLDNVMQDGSVSFAATLLHSMDLCERLAPVQLAVRDAEQFISWYYYVYLPSVEAGVTVTLPTLSGGQSGAKDDLHSPPSAVTPTLASPHLPIDWVRGQDAELRATVFWQRRQTKLDVLEQADQYLACHRHGNGVGSDAAYRTEGLQAKSQAPEYKPGLASRVCLSSGNCDTISERTPCETNSTLGCIVEGTNAAPVQPLAPFHSSVAQSEEQGGLESIDDLTEDEEAYRVVNVGCFGFSFFSRYD